MTNRSSSPLRKQHYVTPISPKIASYSRIARKLPGISPVIGPEGLLSRERCDRVSGLALEKVPRDGIDKTQLAMAAHDLRNPAAALVVYSELLTEMVSHPMTLEQKDLIDAIRSASEFMLRLLDDTLDWAQLQSGTIRLRTKPSLLAPIIEQTLSMSYPLIARKQMRLRFIVEGKPLPVLLDALKISRVFNNLIENATEYCPPGTQIEVRVSRHDGWVVVSVRDDGPGMDPSALKTLCIPFERTTTRVLSEEHGTGLGLAIAKHIIKLHKGEFQVKSKLGKGTAFYVSLPAQALREVRKS